MAATKGTATPLGAVVSPEEARRAAARVAETIADRRAELGSLQGFVDDNAALLSLVQRLPDELSHEIMVPFGSAAFFPGRLIHTNELLVLLGEGYYAERSAKQATEILHRRGKELENRVEAMKATISDLEVEAKFFESTADEASEGLIEIREEYDEDTERKSSKSEVSSSSIGGIGGILDEDKEHARIMARLDELEKEEEEGTGTSDDGEDNEEEKEVISDDNEVDGSFGFPSSRNAGSDQTHGSIGLKSSLKKPIGEKMLSGAPLMPSAETSQPKYPGHASIMSSEVRVPTKSVSFQDEDRHIVSSPKSPPLPPDPSYSAPKVEVSSSDAPSHGPKIISSGRKAFTGSIIEHDDNLPGTQPSRSNVSEKPPSSASSKPISRFRMQKGGH